MSQRVIVVEGTIQKGREETAKAIYRARKEGRHIEFKKYFRVEPSYIGPVLSDWRDGVKGLRCVRD